MKFLSEMKVLLLNVTPTRAVAADVQTFFKVVPLLHFTGNSMLSRILINYTLKRPKISSLTFKSKKSYVLTISFCLLVNLV